MYPTISSPYTGLQQLAKLTLTLSIPLTIISASLLFSVTLITLGAGTFSIGLSIILITPLAVDLPFPIAK